jgi:glycosyltransferase involved in cell wall biosynthesis
VFALVAGLRAWSTAIRRALASADADGPAIRVLYSNGFKAHLAGALVPGLTRVWHLREFPPGGVLQLVWRSLARVLPDGAIANSGATADAWAMMGARPIVVHNGVDLDRFHPSAKTYWLHDQLGLSHDVRLIGMPAVFARWKGHLLVVEAFERVAAQLPDVHLVLVGGPIYDTVAERGYAEELVGRVRRSSLPGIAEPRPLTDRIHFVRHQSEPWRLYPEFDLVVHFSTRAEPFGRVVVEAIASGVPVIASRAGGPLEILQEGLTGWLVPPGHVAGLAGRLVEALRLDLPAFGRRARQDAEQRFSADRYATDVSAALRSLGAIG